MWDPTGAVAMPLEKEIEGGPCTTGWGMPSDSNGTLVKASDSLSHVLAFALPANRVECDRGSLRAREGIG